MKKYGTLLSLIVWVVVQIEDGQVFNYDSLAPFVSKSRCEKYRKSEVRENREHLKEKGAKLKCVPIEWRR
jgi:hypothetical protein